MTNFFLYSPLEQFEIFPISLQYIFLTDGFFVMDNLDLSFLLASFELYFLKTLFMYNKLIFPIVVKYSIETIFVLALSMLWSMVGYAGTRHFPILITLFFFIFILNFLGLIPFGFCTTSQIIVTLYLGFFVIGGLTLKGIQNLKFNFLNLFIPRNIPSLMLLFLSPIEIISYISRLFSLSIRLFANMVAGHALLHILMGAILTIFYVDFFSLFISFFVLIPLLLIFSIVILEMGIAALQAYVFTVLFIIYLNDSCKSH